VIIDIYAHHISREVGKKLLKTKYYGEGKQFNYPPQNADVEVRLVLMKKYGIDVQALSQTTPVLLDFNADDAAEICRISNDDNFTLCKTYPKKFVNICIFSLLDVKSAINELERSVNELDCRGVTLASNQNGKGLDSPEFFPFYDRVANYDLPVFLQPTHWDSYPLIDMEKGWSAMAAFGWPFDTTQAMWRLIMGGVIERYPSLKVITHHCGAMMPFFAHRVQGVAQGYVGKAIPRPISEYWKNFYGDTVLGPNAAASLLCGYEFFGPDRMVYGSDYPFGPENGEGMIRDNLESTKAMDIPANAMQKILGENARKILKI